MFLQQLINGLMVGCLYALLALGYSMVYGVLKMVNFAHGNLFMLGPMFSLVILNAFHFITGHLNLMSGDYNAFQITGILLLVFICGGAFSATIGIIMERLVYRPLRKQNAVWEISLIAAMGVSLILENAAMLVFGNKTKGFPTIINVKYFNIAGASFSNMQVFIIAVVIVLLIFLDFIVNKTYMGRNFRAVSMDRCASGLMGVDVNAVVVFVFILGPAIGAASGVLYSMAYGQVYYMMGSNIGMKGWISAIIGGIGDFRGAVLGGILLGVLETIGAGYLPLITGGQIGSEYRSIFSFIMLIIVLLFRPQGLLGKRGVG
jgi:branched-chain amino acid transport system permease protein